MGSQGENRFVAINTKREQLFLNTNHQKNALKNCPSKKFKDGSLTVFAKFEIF